MKPELSVRQEEVIEIIQKNFTKDEIAKDLSPLLTGDHYEKRDVFFDEKDEKAYRKELEAPSNMAKLKMMLHAHFTEDEIKNLVHELLVRKRS